MIPNLCDCACTWLVCDLDTTWTDCHSHCCITDNYLKFVFLKFLTHEHQFGFKSKQSTDMCIFTVKSVIKYYTEQNTAFIQCLLDAREAFDSVNHWTLFSKLIDTLTPLLIVCVLLFWSQIQNVYIKWGNSYSHYFTTIYLIHTHNGIQDISNVK